VQNLITAIAAACLIRAALGQEPNQPAKPKPTGWTPELIANQYLYTLQAANQVSAFRVEM